MVRVAHHGRHSSKPLGRLRPGILFLASEGSSLSSESGNARVGWHAAMKLLGQARDAFATIASQAPRRPHASLLLRLLDEAYAAAEAWSIPGWSGELDAFDASARLMSFARRGRPSGLVHEVEIRRADGTVAPNDDLDLADRCIRLALAFVRDADSILEGRKLWGNLIERIERAEGGNAGRRKRVAFLRAVDLAARYAEDSPALVYPMMVGLMRWEDVEAAKSITPELAAECVAVWRKTSGQRGKWDTLARACERLGLEGTGNPEQAGRLLNSEWVAARRGREADDVK